GPSPRCEAAAFFCLVFDRRLMYKQLIKHLRAVGFALAGLWGLGTASAAPTVRPVADVIDEYVREALRSNLSLRADSLEVERNIAALDAARARFFPTVSFDARYTRAQGGREI